MDTQTYVKSLFADYEETPELKDFMEELKSNLEDRIASLIHKGLSENEAFAKASGELGDISVLADELSLKRRQEIYQDAYMGIRRYMKIPRIAAYLCFGILLAFGFIAAVLAYFSIYQEGEIVPVRKALVPMFGTLMIFTTLGIGGFVFLGLTQESSAMHPMKKKRALGYTLAAGLISFSLTMAPLSYFAAGHSPVNVISALGLLIPFGLPGAALLAFLVLTEKSRFKPWMRERIARNRETEEYERISGPAAARRRLFSGAIWTGAAACFLLFGFLGGFTYSWTAFIFALALQLALQGMLHKPGAGLPAPGDQFKGRNI
ncbi:MAG: permease prefix domain 1-containing protein [Spirochaetaceae bacterium]|jgi:MFS family permease|nr:permease prefix domain 1-containing protein [Spirochaetaceae bacterium]